MAKDQTWRSVEAVLVRNGWVPKYEGNGNGTAHQPWVHPSQDGVLNIARHGRDGVIKAWLIQEIINKLGRENCPEEWAGGQTLGAKAYEKRLRAEAEERRQAAIALEMEAKRKAAAAAETRAAPSVSLPARKARGGKKAAKGAVLADVSEEPAARRKPRHDKSGKENAPPPKEIPKPRPNRR